MAGFQNALKTHRFLLCILPIDITLGNFSAANASLSCISKVRNWAKKKYCFGHVHMQIPLDFCLFQNHSLFGLIVKVKRFHCKDYVSSFHGQCCFFDILPAIAGNCQTIFDPKLMNLLPNLNYFCSKVRYLSHNTRQLFRFGCWP